MTTPGGWPSPTHTPQPGDMAIPGGRTHDAQPQRSENEPAARRL